VHLKEYSSKNEEALIGEGEMMWKEFIELCNAVGGTESSKKKILPPSIGMCKTMHRKY